MSSSSTAISILPRLIAITEGPQRCRIEPIFNALLATDNVSGTSATKKEKIFESVHYGSKIEEFSELFAAQKQNKDKFVVVMGAPSSPNILEHMFTKENMENQIKLVHCLFTGMDGMQPALLQKLLLDPETKKSKIPLSNARGVYSEMLAQHCILSILYFSRKVATLQSNRKSKIWDRFASPDTTKMTMLLCGYGEIARVVAKRASAGLGMKVVGVRSSRNNNNNSESICPETGARVIFGNEAMDKELPNADVVIAVLPNTPATQKTFNEERFSKFKKGAIFVNIGRGHTVDDDALVKYLQNDRLGGAAIDVFYPEPLPKESPLWGIEDDKMLFTPHNADIGFTLWEDAAEYFAKQVAPRFVLEGKDPEHLVDLMKGY